MEKKMDINNNRKNFEESYRDKYYDLKKWIEYSMMDHIHVYNDFVDRFKENYGYVPLKEYIDAFRHEDEEIGESCIPLVNIYSTLHALCICYRKIINDDSCDCRINRHGYLEVTVDKKIYTENDTDRKDVIFSEYE